MTYAALLLLLGQIQAAEPLVVVEYAPVELTSSITAPEGWEAVHDWVITRADLSRADTAKRTAAGRQYESGTVFAVWGPPGDYEIRHVVTLVNFTEEQIQQKTEYVTLTIQPRAPPADPKPADPTQPGPARRVTYVHQHEQQTVPRPIQAALRKLAEAGIDSMTVDRDYRDASGQIPERFRTALSAISSVPSLVIEGEGDVSVIANPTEQDVLGLLPK